MVRQEYIPKNPITANELKKRRDEGNIKPVSVSDLQRFMNCLDKKTYTGMRTFTIVLVMMDCGIRTKELLGLRDSDFNAMEHTLRVSKTVAKTRRERLLYLSPQTAKAVAAFIHMKPQEWENWLFPNYEGGRLTTTYLDKDFAMLMCGLKENKAYCKPIIKHCNRKQPLQEKKQGKKHRRKRKRKATKWSYNSNIFL